MSKASEKAVGLRNKKINDTAEFIMSEFKGLMDNNKIKIPNINNDKQKEKAVIYHKEFNKMESNIKKILNDLVFGTKAYIPQSGKIEEKI